jgi:hypothetical protein
MLFTRWLSRTKTNARRVQPARRSARRKATRERVSPLAAAEVLEERILLSGFQTGFIELTDVFLNEGDRYFNAGEIIAVSGATPPIAAWTAELTRFTTLKSMLEEGQHPETIDDFLTNYSPSGEGPFDFFPSADVYVIKDTGAPLPAGLKLKDVSGAPNRVIGSGGAGAFISEVVAITQPAGNLGAGRYDIVLDQSEDGFYDPSIDIVLGNGPGFAFEVVIPDEIDEIELHPVKERAATQASILGGGAVKVPGGKLSYPGFCAAFDALVAFSSKAGLIAAGLSTTAGISISQCQDLEAKYKGIAADPPDPNFTELAELREIPYDFEQYDTPFERSIQRVHNTLVEQAALADAFLTTLERFQGAEQAGEHRHLLRQLNHLDELIDRQYGPGGAQLRFYGALESLDLELRGSPVLQGEPETAALRETIKDMRRGIGGLMPVMIEKFFTDPNNPTEISPYGLQAWIRVYNGNDPFIARELPGIPQVRETLGLPPLVYQAPDAQTTGPYTAPPDETITFDAAPSTDPNGDPLTFTWDLDMDGAFDDGTGETVDHAFARPGSRLVGLKATDTDGNTDVEYVLVKIGDRTVQDVVALQHDPRILRRIDPEGNVTTLAEKAIPLSAVSRAVQLDLNEEIFILLAGDGLEETMLHHLDRNGNPLDEISRSEVEQLLGRDVGEAWDLVLDGRGDLLVIAEQPESENHLMIVRVNRAFTRASVVADDILAGRSAPPSMDLDPEGRIIVASVGDPDSDIGAELSYRYGNGGIVAVDPEDGSIEKILPAHNVRLEDGRRLYIQLTLRGRSALSDPLRLWKSPAWWNRGRSARALSAC